MYHPDIVHPFEGRIPDNAGNMYRHLLTVWQHCKSRAPAELDLDLPLVMVVIPVIAAAYVIRRGLRRHSPFKDWDIRNAYNLGCFTMREIADAYRLSVTHVCDIINNKVGFK